MRHALSIPSGAEDSNFVGLLTCRLLSQLVGGQWKIYDMIVENISLVENYRSQFDRILASATFDELLKKLQEKTSAQGG